jgi:hypothetical protein
MYEKYLYLKYRVKIFVFLYILLLQDVFVRIMFLFCGYKICIIFRIEINTYQMKGKYGENMGEGKQYGYWN